MKTVPSLYPITHAKLAIVINELLITNSMSPITTSSWHPQHIEQYKAQLKLQPEKVNQSLMMTFFNHHSEIPINLGGCNRLNILVSQNTTSGSQSKSKFNLNSFQNPHKISLGCVWEQIFHFKL